MKKIALLLIFFTVVLYSCGTFSSFYEPWMDANELYNVITLKEGEYPKIIRSSGNDIDNDFFEIISDHYYCIGSTGFNGPDDDIMNDIKNQCQKNGATLALYAKSYTDTRSGVYSSGNSIRSYNIRRYDYQVYYFIKFLKKIKFGIRVMNLTNQSRQESGRNTGVYVNVVYKDTTAFYANLVRGDVIIRINEYNVFSVDDYYAILDVFDEGEEIEVEYVRRNLINIIKIKL